MTNSRLKRGLVYHQTTIGKGHVERTLTICEKLLNDFSIDFIYGGLSPQAFPNHPNFKLIKLQPIQRIPPTFTEFGDPFCHDSLQELLIKRMEYLKHVLDQPYDFFLSEFFPFGHREFMPEIYTIIAQLKKMNPSCVIGSLTRDVLVSSSKHIDSVIQDIKEHYDYIFSATDPAFFSPVEHFQRAEEFSEKIVSFGCVIEPGKIKELPRKKKIYITYGIRPKQEPLSRVVSQIVSVFPDYEFIFIITPLDEKLRSQLISFKETYSIKNMTISLFLDHFPQKLREASLLITLAGSVVYEAVRTKTPMIMTFTANEQKYRAEKCDHNVKISKYSTFSISS